MAPKKVPQTKSEAMVQYRGNRKVRDGEEVFLAGEAARKADSNKRLDDLLTPAQRVAKRAHQNANRKISRGKKADKDKAAAAALAAGEAPAPPLPDVQVADADPQVLPVPVPVVAAAAGAATPKRPAGLPVSKSLFTPVSFITYFPQLFDEKSK